MKQPPVRKYNGKKMDFVYAGITVNTRAVYLRTKLVAPLVYRQTLCWDKRAQ